jgi:hypothetical protein
MPPEGVDDADANLDLVRGGGDAGRDGENAAAMPALGQPDLAKPSASAWQASATVSATGASFESANPSRPGNDDCAVIRARLLSGRCSG